VSLKDLLGSSVGHNVTNNSVYVVVRPLKITCMYLPYLVVVIRYCISFSDVFRKFGQIDSSLILHLSYVQLHLTGICLEVMRE
jgi:hypothetical protein